MRNILLTFVILVCSPLVLFGQGTGSDQKAKGGSIYSSIGLGIPLENYSSNTMGMGMKGVSVFDPYSFNNSNPALWGRSAYSQGVITVGLKNLEMKDNFGSSTLNSLDVENFQFMLPIVRNRLGFSFGFSPVTQSRYSLFSEGSVSPEAGREPIQFIRDVTGSGGINKMEMGLGYRITDFFSVGYAASLMFASIQSDIGTLFDSPRFSNINYTETISGIGFGNRFGAFAQFSEIIGSNDRISLGGALTLPVNIDSDRKAEAFREIEGRIRSVEVFSDGSFGDGNLKLPLEFDIGLTYNPSRIVNISTEYSEQYWSQANYSFEPAQEQYFVDRTKMSLGAQYHPYMAEQAAGFFSNFKYSGGVSFDTGHLKIDNTRIETLMFHAGIGIVSPRTASSIDLSFQLGFRGTQDENLIQETIWGVKLSLNLAELMFIQPRFQ